MIVESRMDFSEFNDTFGMKRWFAANGAEYEKTVRAELWQHIRKIAKPRPRIRVDQASDRYRNIPASASADPGKFKTSTYEVARGPMMAVTEPGVMLITVCAPTQMLKTTLLESVAMYFMYVDPAPVILVEPNEKASYDVSKNKISPMIASTPVLADIIGENIVERKGYPGGFLKITNAGSPTNIALNPVRVVMCDEIDKYDEIPGHGNPMILAEKRNSTFGDRALSLRVCSPSMPEAPIWKSFLAGDQRLPYVACPHCKHDHVMRWRTLNSDTGEYTYWVDYKDGDGNSDPDTAGYVCPSCDVKWSESDRLMALAEVRWRQTKPFTHCGVWQDPQVEECWDDSAVEVDYATCKECGKRAVSNGHASFNCSRLYSPKPLKYMVVTWMQTFGSMSDLQGFINSDLAEPWEDVKQINISSEGLAGNAEPFLAEVPARVVVLTVGVDTQNDRFAIEVVGWGRNRESWSIHYEEIPGDPGKEHVWRRLDALLFKKWKCEDGREMYIQGSCIDSGGGRTREVYAQCLKREQLRVFCIRGKGANDSGPRLADLWPGTATRNNAEGVSLYELGTRAAKLDIMEQLQITEPGPGFIHSPLGRDISWYGGLVAEKLMRRKGDGAIYFKEKEGYRNEPLDCRVYAMAALEGLKSKSFWNNPDWVEQAADVLGIPIMPTEAELSFWARRDANRIESAKKNIAEAAADMRSNLLDAGRFGEAPAPVVERVEPAPAPVAPVMPFSVGGSGTPRRLIR